MSVPGWLSRFAGRGQARPEIDARSAGIAVLVVFLAPALLVYAGEPDEIRSIEVLDSKPRS